MPQEAGLKNLVIQDIVDTSLVSTKHAGVNAGEREQARSDSTLLVLHRRKQNSRLSRMFVATSLEVWCSI